jgi:hypothetical protein
MDIKLIYDDYLEIFPTSKMTLKEKIMSLIRLLLYLTIIGLIVFRSLGMIFFMGLVIMIIIYYVVKDEKEEKCYRSTINNPVMNVTYIDHIKNPDREKACNEIDKDNIRYNLYENEKDIFMSRNQERIFYTQPITTLVNDQNKYLDFLYDSERKTCKGDRKCI